MRRQVVRIDLNGVVIMANILSTESTQHARNGAQKAIAFYPAQRIGDLSRMVDHDIELLKFNLAQLHDGQDQSRSGALERLESAWETVRSELVEDRASSRLNGQVLPGNGAASTVPTVPSAMRVEKWITGVLEPSVSTRIRQAVHWSRERARRMELRAAALKVWSFASRAALAGAKHVGNGWRGLRAAVGRQAQSWESPWLSLRIRKQTLSFARPPRIATSAQSRYAGSESATDPEGVCSSAWEEVAQLRLESAMETAKSKLALIEGAQRPIPAASSSAHPDEPTTNSQDIPFVLHPIPWVLGALTPVISARTMLTHGSYHAQCVESANRLAQAHNGLAGKNSLEIVRWAREHGRGTELLSMASEAWNHSFYWQCLTPARKRPSGELGKAIDRIYGDFANFADKFAEAGAMHLGSGWLWLTANRRKQVRILTTSGVDCPEANGHTCLLAVDLWEHAYYLDHQNRRREYLDALIDRRLDWDFAEQRFCVFLQRESEARRQTASRAGHLKRHRHLKRRKPATARQ